MTRFAGLNSIGTFFTSQRDLEQCREPCPALVADALALRLGPVVNPSLDIPIRVFPLTQIPQPGHFP